MIEIFGFSGGAVKRNDMRQYRFYEKVVKVKADVAAILNSFPRTPISPERVD
jgi:hypothetical protein